MIEMEKGWLLSKLVVPFAEKIRLELTSIGLG